MLVFDTNNKQKRYRSKLDIVAEILTACEQPIGKTKIMYSVYMSYSQVQDYAKELLTKKFLLYNEETKTFKTSEQGLEYVKLYEKMKMLGREI